MMCSLIGFSPDCFWNSFEPGLFLPPAIPTSPGSRRPWLGAELAFAAASTAGAGRGRLLPGSLWRRAPGAPVPGRLPRTGQRRAGLRAPFLAAGRRAGKPWGSKSFRSSSRPAPTPWILGPLTPRVGRLPRAIPTPCGAELRSPEPAGGLPAWRAHSAAGAKAQPGRLGLLPAQRRRARAAGAAGLGAGAGRAPGAGQGAAGRG